MTALATHDVIKDYPPSVRALDRVSLDVASGEIVVLVGAPGSGKSALLRILAGLDEPTRGGVSVDGRDATGVSPQHRKVAMLFEHAALYPSLSVAENIRFPLVAQRVGKRTLGRLTRSAATAAGVDELLERLPPHLTDDQRQRVALARALVRSPRVLLLDEPLGNVSGATGVALQSLICSLVRESGATTVYATREPDDIPPVADRVGVMRHGRIEDLGPPGRVFRKPDTLYSAALLGGAETTFLRGTVESQEGRCIAVWLSGSTGIALGWSELQARELRHFHGDDVVVAIPSRALRLGGPARNEIGAPVLAAIVRRTAPSGRHTLVRLDIGATAIDPDGGDPFPAAAELTVRTEPDRAPHTREPVFTHVDLDAVHFFEPAGRRIDRGWR